MELKRQVVYRFLRLNRDEREQLLKSEALVSSADFLADVDHALRCERAFAKLCKLGYDAIIAFNNKLIRAREQPASNIEHWLQQLKKQHRRPAPGDFHYAPDGDQIFVSFVHDDGQASNVFLNPHVIARFAHSGKITGVTLRGVQEIVRKARESADRVGDPDFVLRERLERALQAQEPSVTVQELHNAVSERERRLSDAAELTGHMLELVRSGQSDVNIEAWLQRLKTILTSPSS